MRSQTHSGVRSAHLECHDDQAFSAQHYHRRRVLSRDVLLVRAYRHVDDWRALVQTVCWPVLDALIERQARGAERYFSWRPYAPSSGPPNDARVRGWNDVGHHGGRPLAQPSSFRLVIKQADGAFLGTLEIPAGVKFKIGTQFEANVATAYRVDLGDIAPEVTISAVGGASITPAR